MKKIFAIALALVMVLSMASAFASQCSVGPFDWTCATKNTNCGKVKVEVVPYVKVNAACNDIAWEVSTCATAIKGENVYFTLKATVDKHVDPEWFKWSALTIDYSGLDKADVANLWTVKNGAGVETFQSLDRDADKEIVYYWNEATTSWEEVDDDFEFGFKNIITAKVTKASDAKVCAKLTSKYENFTEGVVGKYFVKYGTFENVKAFVVYEDEDETENVVVYTLDADDKVNGIFKKNDKCSTAFYNEVTAFFGITMDTCLNQETVDANLGWDEEVKNCFSWSTKGAAVVDAECVVAIPKTGDKGLLWWLF